MDLTNQSEWDIPPPPINTLHSMPSAVDLECRLQQFLLARQPRSGPRKPPVLSTTKASLNHVLELIQSANHLSTLLTENHQSMSNEEWDLASSTVAEQQQIISALLDDFSLPNRVKHIQKAIRKREKRRKRIQTNIHSIPISPCNPPLVQYPAPSVAPPKPATTMPAKKSAQANEYLALLVQLTELHRVRAQQRGRPCHTPSILTHLTNLWTDASAAIHEKQDVEQPSNSDASVLSADCSHTTRQMWNRVLFGPSGHHKRSTLASDADCDLQRLIDIRYMRMVYLFI